VAQRPAELTPLASTRHFFGAQLRYWRQRRRLSLAQLGKAVYASADLLGKVEKAQRWPSAALVEECEAVLGSGGVLPQLYALAADERSTSVQRPRSEGPVDAPRSMAVIVLVSVHEPAELVALGAPLMPASSVTTLRPADTDGSVVDIASARARQVGLGAGRTAAVARRR
jgi:hypothetical protein